VFVPKAVTTSALSCSNFIAFIGGNRRGIGVHRRFHRFLLE
jgi:hypothetical protein